MTQTRSAGPSTTRDGATAPRTVVALALALVAVGVAVRAWVGYGGWFSLDDYVFYVRAMSRAPFDPDLLLTPYNGHLMPGAMLWVWAASHLAPLGHGLVVTTMLVGVALCGLAVVGLLVDLFGAREAVLVPVGVFTLSTLTLPGSTWWAAALNQLPQVLFTTLALWAQLRAVRSGRARWSLASVLAVAAGLAFSEKTALAMPLVAGFSLLFLLRGTPWQRVRLALRRTPVTWAGYLVLGLAYVAIYAATVVSPVKEGVAAGEVATGLGQALRATVVPGLLGGPWTWRPLGVVDSLAAPSAVMQVVSAAVLLGVVLLSARVGARWRAAWAFAAVAVVVDVVLVIVTRVPVVGADPVLLEYRYFTDLALVLALAVGCAFLPVRGVDPPATDPRPEVSVGSWHLTDDVLRTVALTGLAVLLVGSLVSASGFRERWAANPGRAYVTTALADARTVPATARVYDAPVPDAVVWRLLWPATLPSRLLLPAGGRFTPLAVGEATDDLRDFAADGRLRRSEVSGVPLAVDGAGTCPGPATPTRVRATAGQFFWAWVVQLDYRATSDGTLTLSTPRGASVRVPVRADGSRVWALVEDDVTWLDVTADAGSGACLTGGVVGLPQPVGW
ncbi:hypothetical protein KMZ32_15520 [Phycicoccus sp. MAQZ13P-2]|uniref:hypothetical protein n=1 Tax=Phycicoccus mangrovi TaxID=2840470 RepID=UPI001C008257|nr:hypothetical protein [Phycicoccus mangrovi]MBT9257025.1 hypothetical protein [Phycicoccus mangrovi]MBT9275485.1 hypothetical protein [Phycicoccus mangrovi]